MPENKLRIFRKLLEVLRYEKVEISSIYFYAILSGLVQLTLPLGIQSIISFVLGGSLSTSLVLLVIVVVFGVFIAGLLQVNQMKLIEKIQQQLFVRYAFQYAHAIPGINLKDIDKYYLPELVNRFFDTISLQKGISKLLLDVPAASIQILVGLILLSFYHPVFIFFGILLLTVLWLMMYFTATRGMQSSLEESDYKYKVAGHLEEMARVITTLKFATKNAMHLTKTDLNVGGYLNARTTHFRILLFQYWTLIGFKIIVTAAMLIVGVFLLVNQQLNVGQFIAAEIVIIMVINSVEKLIVNLDKVYDVLTSVEKLSKLIEKPQEPKGKVAFVDTGRAISIKASRLSFSYNGPESPVLEDLNFEILPSEKIAIQGVFGSGKSTLLKLLSGVYFEFQGNLLINNTPISNFEPDSLRAKTGILFQSHGIFEGTLRENICLGNEDISVLELDKLAEIVGLTAFVQDLKEGYEWEIKPTGQHLSGRLLKKILLARALMNGPQLLLLEEPWLGLEETYITQIQNYLLNLKNTTVVVVTNDPGFTEKCDRVLMLDRGKIINEFS